MNSEISAEQTKDQKAIETERFIFRREVQYMVMGKLGYALTKDDNNNNDIFMKWYNDGMAAKFKDCFADIVPPGSDRDKSEIESVANLVAIEMTRELKH